MKTRLTLVVACIATLLLGACSESGNRQTARNLLATIPGDAAYVAVINTEKLVTSTGGKVKDNTVVEPSETLKRVIEGVGRPEITPALDSIFAGDAGVEFSCLAIFTDEGNMWIVAPLADPAKMKNWLAGKGYHLQSAGEGLLTDRDVVLDETKVWLSVRDSSANAAAVEGFKRLNSEQSMLGSEYCEELTSLKNCYIDLWDSNVLWRTLGPEAGNARMLSAFMFEEARYASITGEVSENSLTATGRFLNAEFKDAKCNLATGKLSASDFNILGDKAMAVAGLSLDSKLMKNLVKAVNVFGASLPPSTAELLKNIEGPLVLASDESNNIIISVPCKKGKVSNVANAIEGYMVFFGNNPDIRLTEKEKNVLVSFNGGPQAGVPVKELGSKLEGAWLGMCLSGDYYSGLKNIKDLSVSLVPASSTLEFRLEVIYSNDAKGK